MKVKSKNIEDRCGEQVGFNGSVRYPETEVGIKLFGNMCIMYGSIGNDASEVFKKACEQILLLEDMVGEDEPKRSSLLCNGCEHVELESDDEPCISCRRNANVPDCYKKRG